MERELRNELGARITLLEFLVHQLWANRLLEAPATNEQIEAFGAEARAFLAARTRLPPGALMAVEDRQELMDALLARFDRSWATIMEMVLDHRAKN